MQWFPNWQNGLCENGVGRNCQITSWWEACMEAVVIQQCA